MTLKAGVRLGPYEIQAPIGAGGMGEVYRARDTRLDRTVAIKVLPTDVAGDAAARSRFEREARAIAALDHPHICGIYDVGDHDGTHFLVMPLLEGQTLAARLEKGPLPIEQALKIAAEIADALDKAHRQGIVHRDLKPANIMLGKAGAGSSSVPQAKLLDFGLAKLKGAAGPISLSGMSQMATTSPATGAGTLLGTVPYMAPEQVEGKDADARSDIWALGAVTYEMATGTRPFAGGTPASIIGAILKDDPPPISARQALAPPALDQLVAGCLEKDPEARWQSAADVRRQLIAVGRSPADSARPADPPSLRSRIGWTAAAILSLVLAGDALRSRFFQSEGPPPDVTMFSLYAPPGLAFAGASGSVAAPQLALSPDGRRLVFEITEPLGRTSVWMRRLDETESRPLAGTDNAEHPFWSPDGQAVGFIAQGMLKKLDITRAGPPDVITQATVDTRGSSWSPNGTILYVPSGNVGLLQVPSRGGSGSSVDLDDPSADLMSARWPGFFRTAGVFSIRSATRTRTRKASTLARSTGRGRGAFWAATSARNTPPAICCG
jgi:serine/threonine-protein kinase